MSSLLVNGKIPPKVICPFRVKCSTASKGDCKHAGYNHSIEFSCAFARAHDLLTPAVLKQNQATIVVEDKQ